MRVFTVNKNKGWQVDYYTGMHLAPILFFFPFNVAPSEITPTSTQQGSKVSQPCVNHASDAYTSAAATRWAANVGSTSGEPVRLAVVKRCGFSHKEKR